MTKILALMMVVVVCNSLENDYVSITAPDKWDINKRNGDASADELKFDVTDSVRLQIFTITVNTTSNDYLNCFCAPLKEYEKIQIGGHEAIRYAPDDMTYTLKVKGMKISIDVHKLFNKDEDANAIRKIIESIRLKK